MTKRKRLLLCSLFLALSSCVVGGFRHYEPMGAYLPAAKEQEFIRSDHPGDKQTLSFLNPAIEDLVCFKRDEFVKHEKECHAK